MNNWPTVRLGEVLALDLERVSVDAGTSYPMVGVLSFGRGLFDREPIENGQTSYKYFYRLKPEHVVMSQLFGWEGALALSDDKFSGKYVSPQFPTFTCNPQMLDREFLGSLIQQKIFWDDLGSRTSGMGDRRRTLTPDALFACEIPLPPLAEQQRIVARIAELATRIQKTSNLYKEVESDLGYILMSAYHQIADNAPRRPMKEVAPLNRRQVQARIEEIYPSVAVRSFGRGTFHKPPLAGAEITWQKLFLVKSGDILISNIKAWEGAIAVAAEEDDGYFGSHRYLTCEPILGVASSIFVCFHLLTPEGLHAVGEASPGSADRNRTLSASGLLRIPIPMPSFEKQLWFCEIYNQVTKVKSLQTENTADMKALMPAILDRAFKGELL
jgi:type I restriction enzyme S subunit